MNNQPPQQIQIKGDDATLKGAYANMMQVSHTREEFILDFMNLIPPQGALVSRVMTSPGHMKRIIAALQDNLKKYEDQFGKVAITPGPDKQVGFKTE